MNGISEFFKKNFKDIFKPIIVLLAICIIIPLALSLTNKLTAERITTLEEKNQNSTMQLLLDAESFEKCTFGEKESEDSFEYFKALNNKDTVGYIFVTSAKGYGGEVSVMTAVEPDGKIKEVAVLDVTSETPGLGQNAGKESFYSQFKSKGADIEVVKNGADESKNQINAVTGATITSKGVTSAVNTALERFDAVNKTISTYSDGGDEK